MWEYISRVPTLYTISPNIKRTITHRNIKKFWIYKLTCNTCKLSYVGQTSHNLKQGYKEHIRYTKQNDPQSAYTLTYLLTPWCRVLPEQLTGLQLVKKFPAFHGTRRFITALYIHSTFYKWGTRWRSWQGHSAASPKVPGWIPDGVAGIIHWHNLSGPLWPWGWLSL